MRIPSAQDAPIALVSCLALLMAWGCAGDDSATGGSSEEADGGRDAMTLPADDAEVSGGEGMDAGDTPELDASDAPAMDAGPEDIEDAAPPQPDVASDCEGRDDELCDGKDDDCDGRVDEGFFDADQDGEANCIDDDDDDDGILDDVDNCPTDANADQSDLDGDGLGDPCDDDADGDEWIDGVDCAPLDPLRFPRAIEDCNGLDDDCDERVDEDLLNDCYEGPEGTDGLGACVRGERACENGEWGACEGQITPEAEEICNNEDADCDGTVDEGFDRWWPDADSDGFGDANAVAACEAMGGWVQNGGDCNDGDANVNPDAPDPPDQALTDSDCDGVDGEAGDAVFVNAAAVGDAPDGTRDNPFRDIGAGVRAATRRSISSVLVAAGRYEERVIVQDGVSIFGGYDPTDWTRGERNATTIVSNDLDGEHIVGIRAENIATPTTIELLSVETADHPNASGSSFGVFARNAPGLVLRRLEVRAGNGGGGEGGMDGVRGADGQDGQDGGDCGGAAGAGGVSSCGADGGTGGRGSRRGTDGEAGGGIPGCAGRAGPKGTGGARGGDGGDGCSPDAPGPGRDGDAGGLGGVDEEGFYTPGDGGNGAQGPNGQPGGGGGGGGGASVIDTTGGAGGGGGAGGCGGTSGVGGRGGGGSFGLFVVNSNGLIVEQCTFQTGNGGNGGRGGMGGDGGNGGGGRPGGNGWEAFACGGAAGPGWGGDGGNGATGGRGGHGGGGGGGPSIPIFCVDTVVPQGENVLRPGMGGAGGESPGNAGEVGVAETRVGCD